MGVAIHRFEILHDFAFVPDVVAGGEDINAEIEQIFRQRGRDSETGGGVLAVGENQINAVVAHNSLQSVANNRPSGTAKNVTNKQNPHFNFDGNTQKIAHGFLCVLGCSSRRSRRLKALSAIAIGNPKEIYEYDFGSGAPGPLLRRTDYSCLRQ